jgi:glycosyltransferase involved in cell wall biosynthesis
VTLLADQDSRRAPPAAAAASDGIRPAPLPPPSEVRAKVLAVGFFPPPVDGQRLVTQRMHDALRNVALVRRIELDRMPRLGHLSKALSVGAALVAVLSARARGYRQLYLAPHSGSGLHYSSVIVALARSLGFRLYVHYHSFKNMSRRTRAMAAFVRLCGPEAVHILLGGPMAAGLGRHYPEVGERVLLSNAVFLPEQPPRPKPRGARLRIGHLSNLSRAKGLHGVLETMRRLIAAGIEAELVLAGPATNEETRRTLEEARAEFGDRLDWIGPVRQEEIRHFYDRIDVFLFPTLYEHEAEPLVLLEALSFGVPVLATDRGCIRSLLGEKGGHAFGSERFATAAVEQIRLWAEAPAALVKAAARARTRFAEVRRKSASDLQRLLAGIAETGGSGAAGGGHRPRAVASLPLAPSRATAPRADMASRGSSRIEPAEMRTLAWHLF